MSENKENVVKVVPSSFVQATESKSTPIQSALQLPLAYATGKLFALVSGRTEEVADYDDPSKVSTRAVYEVRVISKNARLPLGTILEIKIKDSQSLLSDEDNVNLLLGVTQQPVVAFDQLSHWVMNRREGLSASGIRILKINVQEAMNYE